MKKYSYPFLFSATIAFLGLVYGVMWWHREVYRITFLSVSTTRYMIVAAMILALFISIYAIGRGAVKSNKHIDYLKFYGGACIVLFFVFAMALITMTYLLPGPVVTYTAAYSYAEGSRKSCAGADVDDPDLGTNIRICHPAGNYAFDNEIFVEKRNNALGSVVMYAMTSP